MPTTQELQSANDALLEAQGKRKALSQKVSTAHVDQLQHRMEEQDEVVTLLQAELAGSQAGEVRPLPACMACMAACRPHPLAHG